MNNAKKGFTLVEVMIVVLILGVLLAIAVPNMFRARENARTKTCVSNLRQIEDGKEQYAMANNLPGGSEVAQDGLSPDYVKVWPECPSGGKYSVNAVDQMPSCTVAGTHTLSTALISSRGGIGRAEGL